MSANTSPDNENTTPNWFGQNNAASSPIPSQTNTLNYKQQDAISQDSPSEPDNTNTIPPGQPHADTVKYEIIQQPEPVSKSGPNIFKLFLNIILFPFKLVIGVFKFLKNGCILLIYLVIIISVGLILVLLFKPPFIWNPIKTFLNEGYEKPEITDNVDIDALYYRINSESLQHKSLALNESEVTALYRDYLAINGSFYVDIEPDNMIYLYNIDDQERPLWLVIDTKKTGEHKFKIESMGFKRFSTPPTISSFVSDTAGTFFNFLEKQVTADNEVEFFKAIIRKYKIDPKININDVTIEKDQIILHVSYSN